MKKLFFILAVIASAGANAQDPQFSQYYAAPLYLNPAFAGTEMGHRLAANYRNQWPNMGGGFATYAFSYDYNMSHLKSGVGLLATVDRAGTAALTSSSISFVYSYKVQLENRWVFTPGLSFGYASRNINMDRLVFGDQLAFDSDGNVPTLDDNLANLGNANYFDFGAGFLFYNEKYWFGYSAAHINQPNRSLIEEESKVPIKNSFHGGMRIPLYNGLMKRNKISSLAPSFIYKSQGEFDQLDVGLHFLYEPIMIGVWYRGIPVQQNVQDNISQDAVVIILGLQFQDVEIGYSYDFTVSELGSISGGAHEVSLLYRFYTGGGYKKKKPEKFIPCPTFNK